MKLSFIIPVYNVENYLRQCVESITQQDYRNIEVILVDDGSNDGSECLCDLLSAEDCRIKVVHIHNGGVSKARNVGLDYVTGEYLMYVDSDDYLLCGNSMFQHLVDLLVENHFPDFMALNHISIYPDGSMTPHREFGIDLQNVNNRDDLIKYQVINKPLLLTPWGKLIKVEFVRRAKLTFMENLLHEDIPWFLDLIDKASSFKYVNEYIYAYRRQRKGSITFSTSSYHIDSRITIIKYLLGRLISMNFTDKSRDYVLSYIAVGYNYCMMNISQNPRIISKHSWKDLKHFPFLFNYSSLPKNKYIRASHMMFGKEITLEFLRLFWLARNAFHKQ